MSCGPNRRTKVLYWGTIPQFRAATISSVWNMRTSMAARGALGIRRLGGGGRRQQEDQGEDEGAEGDRLAEHEAHHLLFCCRQELKRLQGSRDS